jgi:hypothetical protein
LDACWELAQEFDEPAVIITKHTNPCGAATGATLLEAYNKALACDPVSAYGGVIGINREVDIEAAEEIAKLFVEAIAAPAFTPEARERFTRKKNLRLVEVHSAPPKPWVKNVSGGLLLQDADTGHVAASELKVVTKRQPSAEEIKSLLFAWRVCKHVKSNAILYAKDGQTLGVRGPDEPRGLGPLRRDEGCAAAEGLRCGIGRLLSLCRWTGRDRQGWRHRHYPARRLHSRRGSHCRRRQARHGHGLYRHEAFPALGFPAIPKIIRAPSFSLFTAERVGDQDVHTRLAEGESSSRLRGFPPDDGALDLLAGFLLCKAQLVELLQIEPHFR